MASIGSNTQGNGGSGDTTRQSVREAGATAHRAVDQTAENLKPAVDRAAQRAHSMLDQAQGAAAGAANAMARARDASGEWADSMAENIRANPWTAVGIAVVVGFIFGRATAD